MRAHTRIGISTYSASGFAASCTMVGARAIGEAELHALADLVGDVGQVARLEADLERAALVADTASPSSSSCAWPCSGLAADSSRWLRSRLTASPGASARERDRRRRAPRPRRNPSSARVSILSLPRGITRSYSGKVPSISLLVSCTGAEREADLGVGQARPRSRPASPRPACAPRSPSCAARSRRACPSHPRAAAPRRGPGDGRRSRPRAAPRCRRSRRHAGRCR